MAAPISQLNSAAVLEAAAASAVAGSASPLAGLQPGAVIMARVLALLENGQVQLAIGNALIEATTQVPLPLGATVQLAVGNTDSGTTLKFVSQVAPQAVAPQPVAADGSKGAITAPPAVVAIAVSGPGGPAAAEGIASAATFTAPTATVAAEKSTPPPVAPADLPVTVPPQLVSSPAVDAAAALRVAVRTAVVTQNGLAPLYAEIAAAVELPTLPEPVQREALRLLSLRLPLDGNITAEDIKQVFANSGLFLEAQLAESVQPSTNQPASAGAGPIPGAATPATANALPAGDLKAALIVLRQVLAIALAEGEGARTILEAPVIAEAAPASAQAPASAPAIVESRLALSAPPTSAAAGPVLRAPPISPPPPFRGGPMTAQPPAIAMINAATPPHEAVQTLMAATDGALARQTLLQAASLPGQPASQLDGGGPRWNFEVPFAIPQGAHIVTNVAQFEISRDGKAATPVDGVGPVWRARFSVDIDPIGRVHAQIALRGVRTAVTLWAESPEGAAQLRAGATKLTDALRAAELDAGDLVVRDGAPRARAIAAGHFLDRAS